MYFPGTCRKQAKCLTFFTFSSSEKANSPPNCKNPPPPYEIPESSFPDSDFFFSKHDDYDDSHGPTQRHAQPYFVHSHILYIVTSHQLNPHTARAFIHTLQKVLAPTYCSLDNCKIGTVQMNKLKCQF